ncbi:EscU/YscU/HrcU family type III secretion system export apparatus switch protein [Iodobacter fluviatilis]|uniref:EscU/YscU/HrcU family type III secretion system export apparatus switch protein n=1 Tax=Iodobacter fluviatilis TaxID=537 RepID=A0A7G3G5Z8_9NEIS|nr:EscU/YscU/HrcU family type III secretion system export apparatus switch protein [Iodobacter fluviatilis]QBC42538.1 EscU/YscU/HrcU family type III secretion system export apparatus switch protein [Iodobacter fluviatilis]
MSSEKTEKPTPKHLKDAAKKGQTFKSRDLIVALLTMAGVLYIVSAASLVELMAAYRQLIAGGFQQDIQSYSAGILWIGVKLMLPIILLCVVATALPSLLFSGFVLATEALKLNLDALNPVNGFKKLFSLRTVKDLIKSLLYLLSFAVSIYVVWHNKRGLLFAQLSGGPLDMAVIWRELLLSFVLTCMGCIVLILVLDALAEYFLHMKDMKMDKQQVKSEHKEQDGNPEIKSKRREVHQEILSEQIKSDVSNSKLIIANPTHIAIGIFYKPEIIGVPFISLIETNQRALAVRAYAKKVGVPVIRNIALARRILKTHRRYSFIKIDEIEDVLRLLDWLDQVENADKNALPSDPLLDTPLDAPK